MENTGWRKALKKGDVVIVTNHGMRGEDAVMRVARVTPTGRIVVDCGNCQRTFNQMGMEMGVGVWSRSYLEAPTKERIEEIGLCTLRSHAKRMLENVRLGNLDKEDLIHLIMSITPLVPKKAGG